MSHLEWRCKNPRCPKGPNHVFKSQRSLTMHIDQNEACGHRQDNNSGDLSRPFVTMRCNTSVEPGSASNDGFVQNSTDDHISSDELDASHDLLCSSTTATVADDKFSSCLKRKRDEFVVTTQQAAVVKLMKLLDDMNCPDHAFTKMLEWVVEMQKENVSFASALQKREANIRWMRLMLHNANCMLPEMVPTLLAPAMSVDVMRFDFVPQLLSLLQDPSKMVQENLVIDIDQPIPMHSFAKNKPICEVLEGSAYREAHRNAVAANNANAGIRSLFVVPICCWGDATHIDQHGRFKLEPWSFTPLIFKEKVRRKADFWRVLGYVNMLKYSKAERQKLKKGQSCRMYHKQLQTILQHISASSDRLKNVTLPIGPNRNLRVDVVCPLLYVIADTEGADKICGRYVCYSRSIARRCRVCNVMADDLSNPDCNYDTNDSCALTATQKNGSKEDCQNLSMHQVDNAFGSINMGGPSNGIFTATPPDMLHVVRKGVMERLVRSILDELTPTENAALDRMAHHYHSTQKQRCKCSYPKMSFTSGFTNLSFVQAHEWVGILFLLVTLAQTNEGWQLLDHALRRGGNRGMQDALNVMEAILCFDAWLHKDSFWSIEEANEEEERAVSSIKVLMHMCNHVFPNEWHVLKFHLLLHFPFFITKFGAPNNYDSQRPEHNHIAHAKRPGRRAHKTHSGQKFEKQVAQRLADTMIINSLYEKICPNASATAPVMEEQHSSLPSKTTNGAVCFVSKTFCHVTEVWQCKSAVESPDPRLKLPVGVIACLFEHFDCEKILTCTEMHVDKELYRCHPNYRREGPHFDWAIAQLSPSLQRPCKLVAFIPRSGSTDVVNSTLNESHVVLQICSTKGTAHSTLYEEWNLTSEMKVKPVSALVRPCLTILLDDTKVCVAKQHNEWSSEFS